VTNSDQSDARSADQGFCKHQSLIVLRGRMKKTRVEEAERLGDVINA